MSVLWRITCDAFSIVLFLVALHSYFVTSDDGLQSIVVTESLGDIWTELHTDTSLTGSSSWCSLRVSP